MARQPAARRLGRRRRRVRSREDRELNHRYAPQLPLPEQPFIPGGAVARPENTDACLALSPAAWQEHDVFCFGLDCFNHKFYWEAHEVWEAVWHASGRSGPVADCVRGLIRLAAAGVKRAQGQPGGVTKHATGALALFEGLDALSELNSLVAQATALARRIVHDGWQDEAELSP